MLACNLVWGVGDAVTTLARAGSLQRQAHDRGLGAQATYAGGGALLDGGRRGTAWGGRAVHVDPPLLRWD